MNKKMKSILADIETKTEAARAAQDTGDVDTVKALLAEIDEAKADYATEEKLFELEKSTVKVPAASEQKKANGFEVIAKLLRHGKLNAAEKSLLYGDDGETSPTANDENLLVPEDVRTDINEIRRSYISAKDIVTVIPTDSLTGSFVFETGTPAGLVEFDDGGAIDTTNDPTFAKIPWTVKFYGKLIKIGNIIKGAERGGLMAYINKWFVKNAIYSENAKIFTVLKAGQTPVDLKDWDDLKTSINTDLAPSSLIGAAIVTNQTGFNFLDEAVDGLGRPILSPDPSNATKKMFNGLPIMVFSDAQLANVNGDAPIFYGDMKSGAYFMEKNALEFAVSEHAEFKNNMTCLRVIEGFDVIQADSAAYKYGLLDVTA